MRYFAFAILVCICTSSCADTGNTKIEETRGIYYRGHEAFESVFVPCGTKEVWWTEGADEFNKLVTLYKSLIKDPYGKLYIKGQGNFSRMPNDPEYAGKFNPTKLLQHSTDAQVISDCERLQK